MSPVGPFARAEPVSPAPGDIPGLRGAPMRTPVRTGGAVTGPGLWPAIVGRLLSRQLWIELYGLPGYGLTLGGRKATAFAATPRDFRPAEAALGKAVMGGRFALAGTTLEAPGPADPWNRPSPTKAFAVDLHAFVWLPALMLGGDRGAREALRLTLAWGDHFSRWSPFAWRPDILARRVYATACAARRMSAVATEADRLRLADTLGRQARQLLRPPGGLAGKAERLTAAAVAGCVLAGPVGDTIRRAALRRLPRALGETVGPDGGHASRSPEAGLELLLDLLTLDDALAQIAEPTPDAVRAAVERLTAALQTLSLPDGRLVAVQGGGPSSPERVAAALAGDEDVPVESGVTVGGIVRIHSPLLTIVADAAPPGRGAWSAAACAQPLALEIVCGRDRLISGCGWTPRAADRQGLRLTPGHSTLTLGETSIAEPLGGWKADLLGARLVGEPLHVEVEQRTGDGAVWLEVQHDGWVTPYGLLHQRRLYLDQRLDELRAEERLYPAPGQTGVVRVIAAPYAVRFHLEPGVQASLAVPHRWTGRGHRSFGSCRRWPDPAFAADRRARLGPDRRRNQDPLEIESGGGCRRPGLEGDAGGRGC